MKCIVIQRRLLGCEHPEAPPDAIAAHLRECDTCRSWQQRLLTLERHIPLLPVPASAAARSRLLDKVLSPAAPAPAPFIPAPLPRPGTPLPRERALQKLALALSLAAALLLFALAWWLLPPTNTPSPAPPVSRPGLAQVLRDRLQDRLAAAHTPRERVHEVAGLAEEIERQARDHKTDVERVRIYAHFYDELVREHLVRDARAVPRGERPSLEGIARQLREVESEAQRLAADPAQQATAHSWRQIAAAAAEGDRCLRALARGERV